MFPTSSSRYGRNPPPLQAGESSIFLDRIRNASRKVFFGWWVVAAGCVIQGIGAGTSSYGFTIFFLPITRDLDLTRAATSLIFAASRLEGGLEGPIVGVLLDRLGPRKIAAVGIILVGVGFLLLAALAHNFISFFLIYVFVVAIGHNMGFFQAVATAVNSWFIRRRAMAMSITSAASGLGGFLLAPLFSFLVLNLGWRSAAIVVGLIVLITLPAALQLHRSPESRGLLPDGEPLPGGVDKSGSATVKSAPLPMDFTVREALHTSAYWLLTLAVTTRMMVTNAVVVHLVPILVWKGMDEAGAAYLVGFMALASIGTRLLLGWIGDRSSKALMSAVGAVVGLLGLMALLFGQTTETLYFFVLSVAFAEGTIPLNWVLVGDFFGRKSFATLRGLMSMVYSTGVFLSPIYAGWVFDTTGSYQITLVAFSAIFVVSASVFAMLKHPKPPERASEPVC